MAYQNVGRPVFYIDIFSWLKSIGLAVEDSSNFGLDTSEQTIVNQRSITLGGIPMQLDYFAVLGHEMSGSPFNGKFADAPWTQEYYISNYTVTERINCAGGGGNYYTPSYNGFSIIRFTQVDIDVPNNINYFYYSAVGNTSPTIKVATFSMGKTYTMPHSPDLKLTMTREMDGVKRIRTKGGADLVNHKYTKPAMWGVAGAWEVWYNASDLTNQELSRSGRRVWDLSFSYLSDSSVFPDVSALRTYHIEGSDENTHYTENTLLDGDDFYSQVIHKTNGGQLPFIFQPDKDNNNPDGFAIAKFDMNSFKFDQVANGVYNVKLKIREVW